MHLTLSAWIKVKRTIPGNHIFIVILVAFVFSTLQGVKDKLDDPFDGMGEDDINLETFDEWTPGSLDQTNQRMFDTKWECTTEESNSCINKDASNGSKQNDSIIAVSNSSFSIDPLSGTSVKSGENEEPNNNYMNVQLVDLRKNLDKIISMSKSSLQLGCLQLDPLLRSGNRTSLQDDSLLNSDMKTVNHSHEIDCEKHLHHGVSNGGPQVNNKDMHSKRTGMSIEV